MAGDAELSAAFEALRPRLVRQAYAVLGSVGDAEDVVQEAWLRLQRAEEPIRDLGAWLGTVVGRLALDVATSARARRETYVGQWLPEPLVADADPAERVTLDESVGMALMVVLEQLSPAERTAFVLHDVFGYDFAAVGEIVGRSAAATRQLAVRARAHVEAGRPRFDAAPDEQRRVVEAFMAAASGGDLEGLLRVLDPQVVLRGDGGGVVRAPLRPIRGARTVANTLLSFARRTETVSAVRIARVNGAPGLVLDADATRRVFAFTVAGGRITEIDIVRNPAKLRHVPD